MNPLNIRRLFLILLTLAASVLASSCNTVQGFGEDLEQAGDHIEDTAEDAAN